MIEIVTTSVVIAYDISLDDIRGESRKKPLPEARRMIAFLLFKSRFKQTEIANKINCSRSLISRAVEKHLFELTHYEDVAKKYLKTKRIMKINLETRIKQLENWLTENPEADWILRHDKIKELADLNEELSELSIN